MKLLVPRDSPRADSSKGFLLAHQDNFRKIIKTFDEILLKLCVWSGAEVSQSCRSPKMLKNTYLNYKISLDIAENEPSKALVAKAM